MKENKDSGVIRARIEPELKQEFNDIYPNMSEKLIEMIYQAVREKKENYLSEIAAYYKGKPRELEILEAVIDEFYKQNRKSGSVILPNVQKALEKEYGEINIEIYSLIYKNVLNGLYAGKEQDGIETRIERMYRNKAKLLEYIQIKIFGGF